MGRQDLLAEAKALAEDDGTNQARNTGIDMHNGTAGKVDGALVEEPALEALTAVA
jgi:hypothetical protein